MIFHSAKIRVKELSEELGVDYTEIIAICTILEIPASSRLTSLSIDQCKAIIDYLNKLKPEIINNTK
tara:strand:+ start:315 stop:515 length:201 start_codon:yes stop_codon:yes gene_type:complete